MQTDIQKFIAVQSVHSIADVLGISAEHLLFSIARSQEAYAVFYIPKKNGGHRCIEAPDKPLKHIQKLLNIYLQRVYLHIRPEPVHGYVSNNGKQLITRNVLTNAEQHVGSSFILNTDISHFFHAIDIWRVKAVFMSYPFYFSNDVASYLSILTTYQGRLPMGAPTSPVLSNFACFMLDRNLQRYASQKGLTYTRYADDLTFSGNEACKADTLCEVKAILAQEGFSINMDKTRIRSNKSRQTVTGLIVNEKVNVSRTYIRNVRAMLHNWKQQGLTFAAQRNGSPERFIRTLRGKLDFLKMIRSGSDPIYRKLSTQFEELLET